METRKTFQDLLVLKGFLEKSEDQQELLSFLPLREREIFETLPELSASSFEEEDLFSHIHWSWFLPILKNFTEVEQKLFLSAFDLLSAKNLAKELTLSIHDKQSSACAKGFLKKMLLEQLLPKDRPLLPKQLLPKSSLNQLCFLDKQTLSRFIDLLAIYDLSLELRQIVDPKILKRVYALLSDEELTLLKKIRNHKDPFSFGKMGMDRWDESEEMLRTLLHRRGILRLGAGISGQDPDLIRYICYRLDIGRGKQLKKTCAKEKVANMTDVIIAQIEDLL